MACSAAIWARTSRSILARNSSWLSDASLGALLCLILTRIGVVIAPKMRKMRRIVYNCQGKLAESGSQILASQSGLRMTELMMAREVRAWMAESLMR